MIDTLRALLPDVELEPVHSVDGQTTIRLQRQHLLDALRVLRDDPSLSFTTLAEITAVDWWPREPRFEVVYFLASSSQRLRLKVPLHGTDARIPTVQGLWRGAGWLEREVWDMFGIRFDDHGDLRRLLMPEDWEGYPLRKDFPVQIG
jgi:NADH-quinone oxidoreductase subunit C